MKFKLFGLVALSLAMFGVMSVSPSAAQAPIVMTGLSPAGQSLWNKCSAFATPLIREEVASGADTLENRITRWRSTIEKYSGADRRTIGIAQAAVEDDAANGAPTAKVAACFINARLAQLNAPAAPNPSTGSRIVMTGLSPDAQALWSKCGDVATDWMRREMTVESDVTEKEAIETIRSKFETFATANRDQMTFALNSAKEAAAAGKSGAPFQSCLANARMAQINARAAAAPKVATSSRIVITGLSPNAQALWAKCEAVTTRWIRLQMTQSSATQDQVLGFARPRIEAFAAIGWNDMTAAVNSVKEDVAQGKNGAELESCLTSARMTQLSSFPTAQSGAASSAASTQSAADINGLWRGDDSTNEVTMEMRPDGIYVRAVTNNVGQSAPLVYTPAGPGEYHYVFPDGKPSIMKFQGAGVLRLTNPDGWTDVFRLIRRN